MASRAMLVALLVLLVCAFASPIDAAETQYRLRIEWGGGAPRRWQGTISVDQGKFSELRPLGIEADEPGSIWIANGRITIRERSQRGYDALDVLITADPQAIVTVQLDAQDAMQTSKPIRLTLAELTGGMANHPLDARENRLLIRRAPGDRLRIELDRSHLVFGPKENFAFRVQPALEGLAAETPLRVHVEVTAARQRRSVWSHDYDVQLPEGGSESPRVAVEVPVPAEEGAYDLTISAHKRTIRRLVPVVSSRSLAERVIQFVVVDPNAPAAPLAVDGSIDKSSGWLVVAEVDPTNPGWWRRTIQFPQLKGLTGWPQGPLRNGDVQPWSHSLGEMTRLGKPTAASRDTWEAYPLEISRPGRPHVLEIEYPSDVPQHLGVSIVEPNAADVVMPIGIDSGVYVTADAAAGAPRMLSHRLTFWPKTNTPLVLLTQRGDAPSVFHKLRVWAGPERLPRATEREATDDARLVAGFLDRPLFAENFSATGRFDAWSRQSIDDWGTFYSGATRMIDYLNRVGYNGLMLTVMADGSTIYPSEKLQPTPRYDTGMLSNLGQDPVRKDGLEMLFRLFDREQLRLIPALQFTAPLPEIEALLREGGKSSAGLVWVDADGATWLEKNRPSRGLAPYYNPLDSRVQAAMLHVMKDLAERYADHPSFAGVAMQLSAAGYAQLPGPEWGFDDATIAKFERETQLHVPGGLGAERFGQRARFLLGEARPTWLKWRAEAMAEFYGRMQSQLAVFRPGAKLYLAGTGMFHGASARRHMRPALPQTVTIDDVMLEIGLAPELEQANRDVVFLNTQQIAPPGEPTAQGVMHGSLPSGGRRSSQPAAGSLFYHPPQRLRLESFDRLSPFGQAQTFALLVSQPLPDGAWNRRRFVRGLIDHDPPSMFDGGWMLPLGQEDAIRELIEVFRHLPAEGFATSPFSRQPVTIRTCRQADATFIYLVNESPWPADVTLQLEATGECQITELGGGKANQPPAQAMKRPQWTVHLQPYDLRAARISQPDVRVTQAKIESNETTRLALDQRVRDLELRTAALADPPPLPALENPGFEAPLREGRIPGWSLVAGRDAEVKLQETTKESGNYSLRFSSRRQSASLVSNLFPVPKTGRLTIAVSLRTDDSNRQPMLRMVLEDANDGEAYWSSAQVGGTEPNASQITDQWALYYFQVDDLHDAGVSELRVRFDLVGPGEVWIDDVQLHHLKFERDERIELSKIVVSVRGALESGEIADCLRLLEGYWPRFLEANVPVVQPVARHVRAPSRPTQAAEESPKREEKTGMLQRLKGLVPRFMRF